MDLLKCSAPWEGGGGAMTISNPQHDFNTLIAQLAQVIFVTHSHTHTLTHSFTHSLARLTCICPHPLRIKTFHVMHVCQVHGLHHELNFHIPIMPQSTIKFFRNLGNCGSVSWHYLGKEGREGGLGHHRVANKITLYRKFPFSCYTGVTPSPSHRQDILVKGLMFSHEQLGRWG